jgi:hypothetical protein
MSGTSPDPRRNLDEECGYPKNIDIGDYVRMYEREGVAQRVVEVYPDECFSVDPAIYENERENNTAFEEGWQELCQDPDLDPLHYLHRADINSGIGSYGVLYLGTNKKGPLDQPLPGVGADGKAVSRTRDLKLTHLVTLDQSFVTIKEYEKDENNPRCGKPVMYTFKLMDLNKQTTEADVKNAATQDVDVHWSRVIHVADNRRSNEVEGIPRMRPVFNKLMDVMKVLGSSAEMFYKGGFPGISIEIDPRVLENLNLEVADEEDIQDEMYRYMNGIQRYLYIVGMNAKSLAPQVSSPVDTLVSLLNSIAMSLGVPLRIFMGSEQAQLASGQDVRTWNRRIKRRQERYLTPKLFRPFINRLIMIGVLPKPSRKGYKVYWPDVNIPNEEEKSANADRRAAALMKYVMSECYKAVDLESFLRFFMEFEDGQVKEMMRRMKSGEGYQFVTSTEKAAEANAKATLNPPKVPGKPGMVGKSKGPADSGSRKGSPSNPKKGGQVT